jgi:asparagine synthase (glutamine-hydrolysing)
MAAAARHRAAHGQREAQTASATAVHLDGAEEPGIATSSPLTTSDGSLLVVADARLDNRRDLAGELGCPHLASRRDDGALVLEAYRRWGEAFADRFVGDFAVVIWDESRRLLVAARDPGGLRPLVYRVEPERILLASEAKQVLAVPGVPSDPHAARLVAMLAGSAGRPGWTYYEGVERLAPGCTLVVDEHGTRVRPRATPGIPDPERGLSFEECARELSGHLTEAVRARLEVGGTPGLLLSGGLDSTAIAGVAGSLRRAGVAAADLRTYSFAFRELPECDERGVSDLVAAEYGFPTVPVPGDGAWPLAGYPDHGPDRDGPDRFRSHVLHERALDLARSDGVTLLMSGQRGDTLVGANVVDYLGRLRAEGPRAFWADVSMHSRRTGRSRLAVAGRYVVKRLPAAMLSDQRLRALRRLVQIGAGARAPWPAWVRRDAIARYGIRDVIEQDQPRSPLSGSGRRYRHRLLLDPQVARNAEALEGQCARAGLRYADPWADARLARFVLGVPQYLVTPAGEPKGLLREAMRGVLPEAARVLAKKSSPQPAYERGLLDRARTTVWTLIEGSRAAARGFVDERVLRTTYARYLVTKAPIAEREWRVFWRFLDVEDWLRRFHDR